MYTKFGDFLNNNKGLVKNHVSLNVTVMNKNLEVVRKVTFKEGTSVPKKYMGYSLIEAKRHFVNDVPSNECSIIIKEV